MERKKKNAKETRRWYNGVTIACAMTVYKYIHVIHTRACVRIHTSPVCMRIRVVKFFTRYLELINAPKRTLVSLPLFSFSTSRVYFFHPTSDLSRGDKGEKRRSMILDHLRSHFPRTRVLVPLSTTMSRLVAIDKILDNNRTLFLDRQRVSGMEIRRVSGDSEG